MTARTETPAPTVIEAWLAREVIGAYELLLIGDGDLHTARSRVSSSALSHSGHGQRIDVEGKIVRYTAPGARPASGEIAVRRLVEIASSLHTDAKHQHLRAGYRAYLDGADATRRDHYGHRDLTDEQRARADAAFEIYRAGSTALNLARARWWLDTPEDPFAAGLDALRAMASVDDLARLRNVYAKVWATEHEGFAALRRLELSDAAGRAA